MKNNYVSRGTYEIGSLKGPWWAVEDCMGWERVIINTKHYITGIVFKAAFLHPIVA